MPNRFIQSLTSALLGSDRRSYQGSAGLVYLTDTNALVVEDDLTRVQYPLSLPNLAETFNATIPLTAAQIATLHSVPVALVAAPGAGKTLLLEELIYIQTFGTTAWTGTGGVVSPVYHAQTTVLTATTIAAATIKSGASFSQALYGLGTTTTGMTNTGLDLLAATADFTGGGGDSTAVVLVRYRVLPVAL